jgi:uncharacterized protein with PQ loop repeat
MIGGPHFPANSSCPNGIAWIFNVFGDCVDDNIKYAGFLIGIVSLVLWLMPLIPQILENYRNKRCDGLSIYFIAFWMFGDSCNLSGAILTDQLPLQQVIGVYYLMQDCVILSQFIYYVKIYPKRHRQQAIDNDGRTSESSRSGLIVPCVLLASFVVGTSCLNHVDGPYSRDASYIPGRRLLGLVDEEEKIFNSTSDMIGYIVGSIATIAYFCGRLPQVYRNYRRKTLEGLSRFMFVIIWFGNLTYGVSVLMGGSGYVYMMRHLPWLIGSLGLCAFDFIILGQYIKYGADVSSDQRSIIDDDEEDAPLIRPGTIT